MPTTEVGRPCGCGCGRNSPRGEFLRGHAIRHAIALRAEVGFSSDSDAGERAANELAWRGWADWYPSVKKIEVSPSAFGVEAEFFGMDRVDAVRLLESVSLAAMDDGYHHDTKPYWRITHDSSVSEYGNELVSPILLINKESHITQLRKAVTILRDNNGDTDKSCGLHVHHSASKMTPLLIAETLAHYTVFQDAIDSILPKSRRVDSGHNHTDYARGITNIVGINNQLRAPDLTMEAMMRGSAGSLTERQSVINLQALSRHGTIEFRQHSGTLNANKIHNWAKLTKLFMNIGRSKSIIDLLKQHDFLINTVKDEYQDIVRVLNYLGADDKLTEYCLGRRDKFISKTEDEEDKKATEYLRDRNVQEAGVPEPPDSPVGRAQTVDYRQMVNYGWCPICSDYHTLENPHDDDSPED